MWTERIFSMRYVLILVLLMNCYWLFNVAVNNGSLDVRVAVSQEGRWIRTSEGFTVDTQPTLAEYGSIKQGGAGCIRVDLNPEIAHRVTQVRFEQLAAMGYSFNDPEGLFDKFAAAVNKRGTPSKTSDPPVRKPSFDEWVAKSSLKRNTMLVSAGQDDLFGGTKPEQPTKDPFAPDPLKTEIDRLSIEQQEMRDAFRDVRQQVGDLETKVDSSMTEQARKLADIEASISTAITAMEKLANLQKQQMQQTSWERSRLSKLKTTSDGGQSVSSAELTDLKQRIRDENKKGYLLVGQGPAVESEWEAWSTRWNQPVMLAKPNTLEDTAGDNIDAGIWEVWFENGKWLRRQFRSQQQANNSVWASGGSQPVARAARAVAQPIRTVRTMRAMGVGGGGFSSGGSFASGGG